ncbi:MAG: DUF1640 domain-containing protein [Gammaproteobacteria bacterium]|nr:DUF1640 domain-containing protein [Gammaproteobacteria bacterium]
MPSVVEFYEQLASAPDDKTRARLIAEAFERMEERYPEVKELATQSGMRETELRLQTNTTEAEGRLRLEIERLRAEVTREIESLRAELTREIAQTKVDTIKWTAGMLMVQLGLFGALLKLLLP